MNHAYSENMKLRPLEKKDVPGMLEWMHDEESLEFFRFDTVHTTEEQACLFVDGSFSVTDRHYAIVDDDDSYLGTISLKNINLDKKSAEYAIVLRKSARGTGVAQCATKELLGIAFHEIGLTVVYLNVYVENLRAVNFYRKMGFQDLHKTDEVITASGEKKQINWYFFPEENYLTCRGCRRLAFDVHGDERGRLIAVESGRDIPFHMKRLFYIYGTEEDVARGCHANRKSSFLFICMSGSVRIDIDDGENKDSILMKEKNNALYLPPMTWKRMYDFSDDAVLLVLSDEFYDSNEYIQDYDEFINEVKVSE